MERLNVFHWLNYWVDTMYTMLTIFSTLGEHKKRLTEIVFMITIYS